ncbi:class II aaRS and biotin synthetase [Trametopsis cervina]|nr:class II aaRS and biotin synthetase [Trametopsis cervina]
MNVLVYTGPEVLQTSASRTLTSLRTVLYPHYAVQPLTAQAFSSGPWSASCALLVFPACRLPLPKAVAQSLRLFVVNGGAFLGIRAGMRVGGGSLLGGFGGDEYSFRVQDPTGSNTYCTFVSGEDVEGRVVSVKLQGEDAVYPLHEAINGEFEGIEGAKNAVVLARYAEHDKIAAASVNVGTGKVALWGPHIEAAILEGASGLSIAETQTAESKRLDMLRATLSVLGLKPPSQGSDGPAHPLPQFLLAARPGIVSNILDALSVKPPAQFKDAHDTFVFHDASDAETALQKARGNKEGDELRHVIAYTDGSHPAEELTPLFSTKQYFADLATARARAPTSEGSAAQWAVGDAIFYGEAVTSTQTLLDKNPRFLSLLPSPVLSIATHQLAGRGRGGNSWVSPTGCLQFSLRLSVSLSNFPPAKLVFVQYLFALAVVQACRDDAVLGEYGDRVRIKWPNDVYVVGEDEGGSRTGTTSPAKVAGILVYTAFTGGEVDIIIGCGLNVLSPPPMASLASVLPSGSERALSMERTLAVVVSRFEGMWSRFLAGKGSFEPFMDLYLDRWLHSDQVVTVTSTTPHRRVRVVGITGDHGLLRTIPEGSGSGYGSTEGFIDLQPDGNSFDLMAGLIMTKVR